jgi:hypothetical protein
MAHHGFQTDELIPYQRYGLENHLNWLTQGRPGGNEIFRALFKGVENAYMASLEKSEKTDTIIWAGKVNHP